jgi:Flp pilus assembly protein TadD
MGQGQALLAAGRPDLARDRFREALRDDPENGLAHSLLAACLLSEGDVRAARNASDQAIGLLPEDALVWRVHANVLNVDSGADAGEEAATTAIHLAPDSAKAFEIRGRSRLALGRPAEALEDVDHALMLAPADPEIHAFRAVVLTHLGRGEEAETAAADALALDPESAAAHAALGWQHLHAGHADEALAELQDALRIDPMNASARSGLVESLKAQSPIYAAALRVTLTAGRYRSLTKWLGIGGLIVFRALVLAAMDAPETRPFAFAFIVVLLAVMGVLWCASPLFSFLASRTPQGRHVIDPNEARVGAGIVAAAVTGALLGVAWATTGYDALGAAALAAPSYAVLNAIAARTGNRLHRLAVAALVTAAALQASGIVLAVKGTASGWAMMLVLAPCWLTLLAALPWRRPVRTTRTGPRVPGATPALQAMAFDVAWYIRWPVALGGLFFGTAMIGSIQNPGISQPAVMILLCGAVYLGLCGPVFAGRELYTLASDIRAHQLRRRSLPMLMILLTALVVWVTALVTGQAVARGAFALACFIVCAVAPVVGQRSVRPRLLLGSVILFSFISALAGGYAIATGQTHGANGYLIDPAADWAGFGLFMVLAIPVLRCLPAYLRARLRPWQDPSRSAS